MSHPWLGCSAEDGSGLSLSASVVVLVALLCFVFRIFSPVYVGGPGGGGGGHYPTNRISPPKS